MESKSYDRMCAVVRQYHAHQSRNGGRVPYAQHCERVAHLLRYVLDKTAEATGAQRENILLAALGHDLLEDTSIDRSSLSGQFSDDVAALIWEVTNTRGDNHVSDYVEKLRTVSDAALLIKLADLAENTMNASYAVHENGTQATRYWEEALMRPQYEVLRSRACDTMPKSARLLNQFAEFALGAMRQAVGGEPGQTG
jgi:(p)ppGpp synthase/HD superfamily hydrolase